MNREYQRKSFIKKSIGSYDNLVTIAGDASFRSYYRVVESGVSYILMDAPPDKEDSFHFAQVAKGFSQAGIRVPEIISSDYEYGFLLLSDFGDELLFNKLNHNSKYLEPALDMLLLIQSQGGQHILELPEYGHKLLLKELLLLRYWFVQQWLGYSLTTDEEKKLDSLFQLLITSAEKQTKTWVHRDYHSKNLLWTKHEKIGVIDFQDAVLGPVTYDLVSLLKDCYIYYSKDTIKKYLEYYYINLISKEIIYKDFSDFERSFDYMGLQRHIKVLGIFSRLSIRDNKHSYINYLPKVFSYIDTMLEKYHELQQYKKLFEKLSIKMHERLK